MNQPKVDVTQLLKRDPAAWTALLSSREGMEDVEVTAVRAEPVQTTSSTQFRHHTIRYILTLANHSDPISLIGKKTGKIETLFYRDVATEIAFMAPHCWFVHDDWEEQGWVVLDDVPNHYPPEEWGHGHVDEIIHDMTTLHAAFWGQESELRDYEWLPYLIGRHHKTYTWEELRQEQAIFFQEDGPGAALSQHAIYNAGHLAPRLLQAANGLTVMRSLGGWPGILAESHLTAAADLLDDPVPMLEPLNDLPPTLIHGDPHNYHWRLTLFNQRRLLDWQNVVIGPGLFDLVAFIEQFNLLYTNDDERRMYVRPQPSVTEETIVDSYMLVMSYKLGSQFNARQVRQAIPAARCLYVLTQWFPHFATWFSQMPNKYTWQKVNRMSDEQLKETPFHDIAGFRPYLAAVFKRFLQAYRTL